LPLGQGFYPISFVGDGQLNKFTIDILYSISLSKRWHKKTRKVSGFFYVLISVD
jgi:hypothetical protein